MPTLIAFSARRGDSFVVFEEIDEVRRELAGAKREPEGLCSLTHVPGRLEQRFEPAQVLVNPQRVAYLRVADQSS